MMIAEDRGECERLANENAKLRKINAALMSRVERSMDQPTNAFGLFEVAISLDKTVRGRTNELQAALRSVERSNEALKRAKLQADQANSFKSTFLAFVTHDLLQPLHAAKLSLSALMEMEAEGPGAPFARQVDQALTSLEELMRTLLDISKLDAGVMEPDVCAFEMERVLAPLRRDFESVAATRGLKLKVRPCSQFVRSDPLMMRRILQNLLNNALRYTRRGGVLLGCRVRGDRLQIEVSDTGPGIPEDRREAIFEEFQRGRATPGDYGGFGLGLSIVRRLAAALDHKVDLVSRVGLGSTFSISAPITQADSASQTPDSKWTVAPVGGLNGAVVLVIENEPAVARAMRGLLERWGCHVALAASCLEACEIVRQNERGPNLIIADAHLDNGERGFEAIERVRQEIDIPVPACIVTADHSEALSAAATAQGLEILRKPVKPAELRSLMSYLLA